MPGLIRNFRFLEKLFPVQKTGEIVQPNQVENSILLTHSIMNPSLITGFILKSRSVQSVAAGGSETFAFLIEPAVGNISLPIHIATTNNSVANVHTQVKTSATVNSPDAWGRWDPMNLSSVATRGGIFVAVQSPPIPRGNDLTVTLTLVAGEVVNLNSLYLEGPGELVAREFFRPYGNMGFTSGL